MCASKHTSGSGDKFPFSQTQSSIRLAHSTPHISDEILCAFVRIARAAALTPTAKPSPSNRTHALWHRYRAYSCVVSIDPSSKRFRHSHSVVVIVVAFGSFSSCIFYGSAHRQWHRHRCESRAHTHTKNNTQQKEKGRKRKGKKKEYFAERKRWEKDERDNIQYIPLGSMLFCLLTNAFCLRLLLSFAWLCMREMCWSASVCVWIMGLCAFEFVRIAWLCLCLSHSHSVQRSSSRENASEGDFDPKASSVDCIFHCLWSIPICALQNKFEVLRESLASVASTVDFCRPNIWLNQHCKIQIQNLQFIQLIYVRAAAKCSNSVIGQSSKRD